MNNEIIIHCCKCSKVSVSVSMFEWIFLAIFALLAVGFVLYGYWLSRKDDGSWWG